MEENRYRKPSFRFIFHRCFFPKIDSWVFLWFGAFASTTVFRLHQTALQSYSTTRASELRNLRESAFACEDIRFSYGSDARGMLSSSPLGHEMFASRQSLIFTKRKVSRHESATLVSRNLNQFTLRRPSRLAASTSSGDLPFSFILSPILIVSGTFLPTHREPCASNGVEHNISSTINILVYIPCAHKRPRANEDWGWWETCQHRQSRAEALKTLLHLKTDPSGMNGAKTSHCLRAVDDRHRND